MELTNWLVIAAGLAAVTWVNWYFFLARQAPAVAAVTSGPSSRQEISIVVEGGYTPSTIRVKAGQPVRLTFDRRESSSCSEEVVFPDFALRQFLPQGKGTAVDITPPAPGTYEFTCGMGMLHGRVIAE